MKCKSCGANFSFIERTCPYCGTDNALGQIWGPKLDHHKAVNAAAKKEAEIRTPRVVYERVVGRIFILELGILILALLFLGASFLFHEKVLKTKAQWNKEEYFAELDQMVQEEDWNGICLYVENKNLRYEEDYEYYVHIALTEETHQNFDQYRISLEDVKFVDTFNNRDRYIEEIIEQAQALLQGRSRNGFVEEYNLPTAMSSIYKKEAEDCLLYQLKLDSSDIAKLRSGDYVEHSYMVELIAKVKENNGWED